MTAVVFLGPTLARRDAERLLDAVLLPPAGQGDIFRAVREHRPVAIGLIDGAFAEVRAVWHREILWALSQGVHVFGAASMGALRAVELAPFGMRGVGAVFRAYSDGIWPGFAEPFEDDDEVAVIHAPAEVGGGALSDAMVDLRATLLAAEAEGVIDRGQRDSLACRLKQMHFGTRSFARLAAFGIAELGGEAGRAFATWLERNRIYRKRLDAIELLEEMARFLAAGPDSFMASFTMERALVWERFITSAAPPVPLTEAEQLVLDELRLDPERWHQTTLLALGRSQALAAAGDNEPRTLTERIDAFRRTRGLWRRTDLDAWLADHALTEAQLGRMLREEARLGEAARGRHADLTGAMLDHLRLSGAFATLHRRAATKSTQSATTARAPAGPLLDEALDWYFSSRNNGRRPRSIAVYARDLGWRDQAAFETAVWREYRFAARHEVEAAP